MGIFTYGFLNLAMVDRRLSVRPLKLVNRDFFALKTDLEWLARKQPDGVFVEFHANLFTPTIWVQSPQVWKDKPGQGWLMATLEGEGICDAVSFPGALAVSLLEVEQSPDAWANLAFHGPKEHEPEKPKGRKPRRFDFLTVSVHRDGESRLFEFSMLLQSKEKWMKITAKSLGYPDGVAASIDFSPSWPRGFPPFVLIANLNEGKPQLFIVALSEPIGPEVLK